MGDLMHTEKGVSLEPLVCAQGHGSRMSRHSCGDVPVRDSAAPIPSRGSVGTTFRHE